MLSHDVYISVGSNIGNREAHLNFAIKELDKLEGFSVQMVSPIYETAPIGYTEQPAFLNLAIYGKTGYSPIELLKQLQAIEGKANRVRDVRWGPRTLDLDILLYNQETMIMDNLLIPHPRMKERGFVMIPLYDLSPELVLPPEHTPIAQLYQQFVNEPGITRWQGSKVGL